eukprot:TRINITY_DN551_c0_g1_i1.p1 TRINITY_DN551_c0_g1~~TRINITY_DN551_c0_g1_i1.p1  ORF type:complete len:369 (+),score=74.68 TRINITY_DN551_c0_g1_i1:76-1182(+)
MQSEQDLVEFIGNHFCDHVDQSEILYKLGVVDIINMETLENYFLENIEVDDTDVISELDIEEEFYYILKEELRKHVDNINNNELNEDEDSNEKNENSCKDISEIIYDKKLDDRTKINKIKEYSKKIFGINGLDSENIKFTIKRTGENYPFIKKLYFVELNLKKIPDEICNIINLQDLSLQRNSIKIIPDSITECKDLNTLWLYKNRIECIDPIGQLLSLKYLNLGCNKINKIPESFKNLTKLEHLFLNSNSLEDFNVICNLTNLTNLLLSNNRIKTIPEDIVDLVNLEDLKLGKNDITVIPDAIGSLSKLEKLDISNNRIENLTSKIGDLKLTSLNLVSTLIQLDSNVKNKLEGNGCNIIFEMAAQNK